MIVLVAILGIAAGWAINQLSDALLRFSSQRGRAPSGVPKLPAVVRVFQRSTQEPHFTVHLLSEVITAAVFALLFGLYGGSAAAFVLMAICAYYLLIMVMDLKYRLVLNVLTYPAIVLALIVNLVVLRQPALNVLMGVVFAFGIFYVTTLLRPNGLGGGDVKLAALLGATFGFPLVLWALIVSAAASAVVIAFLLLRRRTTRDTIPYAPFLCLGAVAVLIYSGTLFT